MSVRSDRAAMRWPMIVIPAMALSIGWGIRGNFGHEHGAMIPGALAAMGAVLVSGRHDWHRRIAFFALFGAIGWAFGGSMSYGHVLSYTHCGDPPNVLYGFASLYLIGFLWGALGGLGTALPAYLNRERLTEFFPPLLWFFAILTLHDLTYDPLNVWLARWLHGKTISGNPLYRQEEPLYWYDSDWTTALIGILVPLVYRLARRKRDEATALMLHLAIGWWVGFLLFPVLLHWRMTPPRGDNWAGCLGAVGAAWFYLRRRNLSGVLLASLVTGFVGGVGFSLATALQIAELRTGWQTNWHSILEQTYGLINGIGIGVAMWLSARSAPEVSDDPPVRRWTDWFAPACVVLLLTYLNARKNPEEWVKAGAMSQVLYWFQPITWFNIGYLALAAAVIWVLVRHCRKPIALLSGSWLAKGELLFLTFLWCMVAVNFERAVVSFAPQRLVTEGVILLHAALLSALLLITAGSVTPSAAEAGYGTRMLRRTITVGIPGAIVCCLVCLGLTLATWGTRPVEFRGKHIRFGPHATAHDEIPAGAIHP